MSKTKKNNKRTETATDAQQVEAYLDSLQHPLKKELEAVRKIIRESHPDLSERIKWNAPSYYGREDLLTFNPRATRHVHLVFHHPAIVQINSPILQGDYKDRRMVYFENMDAVEQQKTELKRIIRELMTLTS